MRWLEKLNTEGDEVVSYFLQTRDGNASRQAGSVMLYANKTLRPFWVARPYGNLRIGDTNQPNRGVSFDTAAEAKQWLETLAKLGGHT